MKIGNLEVYGIIYKITNTINGKVYIDRTFVNKTVAIHEGKIEILDADTNVPDNAEVFDGAASDSAEQTDVVASFVVYVQTAHRVAAAVKGASEAAGVGVGVRGRVVVADGDPTVLEVGQALYAYINVLLEVEGHILGGTPFLDVLRQKGKLDAGGDAVMSARNTVDAAVVQLSHR